MRILAVDCAGAASAAALLCDGRPPQVRRIPAERGHAEFLMPLLLGLVADAGLTLADLDRFAATTGPGSFTGIRVGLAAARGLGLATGKPVIGITAFEALAAAAGPGGTPLAIVVESKREELFVQRFGPDLEPLGPPEMLPVPAIAQGLAGCAWRVVGDAAHRLGAIPNAEIRTMAVDPAIVAQLAATRDAVGPPTPFYVRAPDVTMVRPAPG